MANHSRRHSVQRLSFSVDEGDPLDRRQVTNLQFLKGLLDKHQESRSEGKLLVDILPVTGVLCNKVQMDLVAGLDGVKVDTGEVGEVCSVGTDKLI